MHRGAVDPHGEGGRGPVRGGLDGRRGGRARPVAGGAARGRRPAGARARTGSSAHAARRATRPISCCRECCMRRSCGARTPRRRVRSLDLAPALALRGRARRDLVPATSTPSPTSRTTRARPSRPSPPTPRRRHGPPSRRSRSSGTSRSRCSIPTRPCAGRTSPPTRPSTRAATSERASPKRTSSWRPSSAPRASSTARWRPTRRCASGRATRCTSTSRPSSSGASATPSRSGFGLPPDRVRVVCEYMGGGFGSKNGPGDYTLIAAELARRTGQSGPLRAHAARGEHGRREPQRDDPAPAGRRALGRDAGRARRRVHERRRLERLGVEHGRADADALRLRERRDDAARREAELGADGGLPRARASSRGRSGSSACSTSWPRSSTSIRSSCVGATTRTPT